MDVVALAASFLGPRNEPHFRRKGRTLSCLREWVIGVIDESGAYTIEDSGYFFEVKLGE